MIDIWCYWSQGNNKLDNLSKLCVNNWKRHLYKDYKINILSKKKFLKIQTEIDKNFFNKLTYQQQSDIVRLYLLYQFGGIWIDISTILTNDLSWVIDKFNKGYEIVGFYVEYPFSKKSKYLFENWFIAVNKPYNYIIFNWKKTFLNILQNDIIYSDKWRKADKSTIPFRLRKYLSMHVANLWCIQNNDKYKKMYNDNVYVYKANKTALVCMNFDSIFTKGIGSNINFPMIKLTSPDRWILKYFYSARLKNIINKNLETTYIKHSMLIQKILIITIIIIFFLFYRKIV